MEIRLLGAEINADRRTNGRTDGRTDGRIDGETDRPAGMTNVIFAIRTSANKPAKGCA